MDYLLVGSTAMNQVLAYNLAGGAFVSIFIDSGSGDSELVNPRGIKIGPNDGKIYVVSSRDPNNSAVLRYLADGTFDTVFCEGNGMDHPQGIAFDSSGNLYVANRGGNNVLRFASTGNFMNVFASHRHELFQPTGVAFDAGGSLYVTTESDMGWPNRFGVLRFNSDGSFSTRFASVFNPFDLVFNSNGDLLVSLWREGLPGNVTLLDGASGQIKSVFAAGGPLDYPQGLALYGDMLLVASQRNYSVLAYDNVSGQFQSVFASGGGLESPAFLAVLGS